MDLQHIKKLLPKHLKNIWIVLWKYFWMILQWIMTWRIICRSSDYVFKSAKNMALF